MAKILMPYLAVAMGGAIGCCLRQFFNQLATRFSMEGVYATFAANILGCLLIGILFAVSIDIPSLQKPWVRHFLFVGFLGGLTTFSSFVLETYLLSSTHLFKGLAYLLFSQALGFFGLFFGFKLARLLA